MERSKVNEILLEGDRFIRSFGYVMPPFAYWSPEEMKRRVSDDSALIRQSRLGWDITDYGQGKFDELGLFLFTVRNGSVDDLKAGKGMLYAEKIMISRENQISPMHTHALKAEDIINRGGGKLVIELFSSTPDGQIDREAPVEVLTDGASSIYGGDAVAGVINFILRDDFEGAETTASYGTVTEGRMEEYRFSQTAGTAWDSGNVLGAYDYSSRDNLTLADRPGIGLFQPRLAGDVLPEPRLLDLLPAQTRHSLLLSGRQQVGSKLSLSASGLYSQRDTERTRFNQNTSIDTYDTRSEGITLALGAEYEIGSSWAASLDASYGQIRNKQARFRIEHGMSPVSDHETDRENCLRRISGTS